MSNLCINVCFHYLILLLLFLFLKDLYSKEKFCFKNVYILYFQCNFCQLIMRHCEVQEH